jgi:hypothetical protein
MNISLLIAGIVYFILNCPVYTKCMANRQSPVISAPIIAFEIGHELWGVGGAM